MSEVGYSKRMCGTVREQKQEGHRGNEFFIEEECGCEVCIYDLSAGKAGRLWLSFTLPCRSRN